MKKEIFQNTYMIGIKGAGMAALAVLLKKKGMTVSGCDVPEVFFTDHILHDAHIPVYGFSGLIPEEARAVVYSTAWEKSSEVALAHEKGISLFTYPQAIAILFNDAFGIAVCGSHGKTTTSAMLAWILHRVGKDPSAVIGSEIPQLGTNALAGASPYFVLEADEYQNKLELYHPKAAIMTNVDYDHPDFFSNEEEYRSTFRHFADTCTGPIVACWDDAGVRSIFQEKAHSSLIRYGTDPNICDYALSDYRAHAGSAECKIWKHQKYIGIITLSVVGVHMAQNALAAFAMADTLGIADQAHIIDALLEFHGTRRRFELKGTCGALRIIDDYAHHPAEIRATLAAAREAYPEKKIWCIFGPHTFSRTIALLDDFSQSFQDCDRVLILDIYGSARERAGGVHSCDLVEKINAFSSNAEYVATHEDALYCVRNAFDSIDILITMGAGDVNRIGERIIAECIQVKG